MYDVIAIGTATRDTFLQSPYFKAFRDPKHFSEKDFPTGEAECLALGAKIYIESLTYVGGGDAANAAVTFARQGLRTGLFAKVGDDEGGDKTIKELKKEKVAFLSKHKSKKISDHSTILLSPEGERTVLVYRGASKDVGSKDIPAHIPRTEWIYLAPGNISPALLLPMLTQAKKSGVRIAINPSGYYIKEKMTELKKMLRLADVVIANREEAAQIVNVPFQEERIIFKKFDELISGIAIMTNGSRGATASDGKMIYRAKSFKEKTLIDRTGAGDAFGAGFVSGFIEKNDIGYALRIAAANATSVVEHIGAREGILSKSQCKNNRWKFIDLDVEPL